MAFDNIAEAVKADDLVSFSTAALYTPGVQTLQNGNKFVYIYNAGNSIIGTGKYCVLDGGSNSFSSGYSVTVTNASLAGWMVGVAQATIPTGTYGWVMSNGFSLIAPDGGQVSANVGVDLALGTDGGFVAAAVTFSTAPRVGYTINSFVTTPATSKARIWSMY